MTKLYTIPEIKWKTALLHQDGIVREVKFTEDTFIEYFIHAEIDGMHRCYYGNGRFRDFKTEEEAKEWVSEVHYPAQVEKYLNLITNQTHNKPTAKQQETEILL
ncbi:hypothetical protein AAX06_06185 [Moraxella bovoculi]|uniref:Uncharacterized protein n=1 Tax=Moraxella bovoculi TaxID=386891 RepID=A0AAC8PWQ5_9GAMM|nr:hypothetical protein [Moraxella bovoculi]AKG07812.1 hypothetical protein AAX06_06185 [Moraxella bovoculi]AKG11510.1 hypothetical protein AAX07_05340 [Moraxella bovoculi]